MRPIVPLIFTNIRPVNMAGVPGVDWDLVAPTDIFVDESYQRELSRKSMTLIRRMVEGWSWAKFKAPTCVRAGGQLRCIDGQHTATAAASHGGIPYIPVLVVSAPTLVEQADAFISHSRDRVVATPPQIHHAALAAGDKGALQLQRVCDLAGLRLVLSPKPPTAYRPGETIAIKNVRGVLSRRGDRLARDVLTALVQSGIAPIRGDDVQTADALLCEPDFNEGFDVERVAAALRDTDAKQRQDAEALAVAKGMPMWKAMAAVLCRAKKSRPRAASPAPEPAVEPAPAGPTFTSVLGPARSAAARVIDRRPSGPMSMGDPEPGRSALDERRRATA